MYFVLVFDLQDIFPRISLSEHTSSGMVLKFLLYKEILLEVRAHKCAPHQFTLGEWEA